MKFGKKLYQEMYSEHKIEKAHEDSKKDLLKTIYDGGKNFVLNYNPFIGLLPVKTQKDLRDKKGKTFGSLSLEKTVLASAIGLGLGAYFVGLNLNGFDMGFDLMEKVFLSSEIVEIPKYISFPFIWGGFPKIATQIVSYYLIGDSAIRTVAALAGKPLGSLVGEAVSYVLERKSKKSSIWKEKEEAILRDQKQASAAAEFTELERKELEDNIANISKEIWKAKQAGDKIKETGLQTSLDLLLARIDG